MSFIDVLYSAGPDKVPSCILKHCEQNLSFPITHLFTLSISLPCLTGVWNESVALPNHQLFLIFWNIITLSLIATSLQFPNIPHTGINLYK